MSDLSSGPQHKNSKRTKQLSIQKLNAICIDYIDIYLFIYQYLIIQLKMSTCLLLSLNTTHKRQKTNRSYCDQFHRKSHNCLPRLSKKSFVGFHMARDPKYASHATPHFWREMQMKTLQARQVDLSRLRRSRSAASRPKKARSARQEVDLQQVY